MKKIVILLVVLVILLTFSIFLTFSSFSQNSKNSQSNNNNKTNNDNVSHLVIKGNTIFVEIADSPQKQEKGLSARTGLAQNKGMLFLFDRAQNYNFWMKGMLIPLDFVWINDKTVVDVSQNVPFPVNGEKPVVVRPDKPVDKVLEVNAGYIKKHNIKVNDTVEFFLFN